MGKEPCACLMFVNAARSTWQSVCSRHAVSMAACLAGSQHAVSMAASMAGSQHAVSVAVREAVSMTVIVGVSVTVSMAVNIVGRTNLFQYHDDSSRFCENLGNLSQNEVEYIINTRIYLLSQETVAVFVYIMSVTFPYVYINVYYNICASFPYVL